MKIVNAINNKYVPKWGNGKKYIAIHYLGVVGQNNKIESSGSGAHYYIYWDGTVYQAVSDDAIVWQVGTAGYYKQLHKSANNNNVIGIELCVKCDGNQNNPEDPKWYFTKETQEAAVELVKYLMKKYSIPAANVLRHGDIVNKHCPAPYMNNNAYKTSWTWQQFKAKLNSETASTPVETPKVTVPTGFMVRTKTTMNVRKGPGTSYAVTMVAPVGAYTIVETNGSWGKLMSGAGWINISSKYADRIQL